MRIKYLISCSAKIVLIFFLVGMLTFCAFDTSARTFSPAQNSFESDSYDLKIRSGFEMTEARTVFFYVPTGYKERYERIPKRTIHLSVYPKCMDFHMDFSKVILEGDDFEMRGPVRVREYSEYPGNYTSLDTLKTKEVKISSYEKIKNFSLEYDVSGLNVGDSVSLKIRGLFCGDSRLPEQIVILREEIISFYRN